MITAYIYAICVTLFAVLARIDARLAWGSPREMDWDRECVVITGGSGGLGRVIVEMFARKGVSIAVLDVVPPRAVQGEEWENVHFYHCDVGNIEAVQKVAKQMDADSLHPTILLNLAATLHPSPLLSLPASLISSSLTTNLASSFNTIHTFLPHLLSSPTGGTIVTLSSVLGKLGAANLATYTAAKAGQIALHNSVRAELALSSAPAGSDRIRMILVTPGQLATPLFDGIETPNNFLGPVVEPVELAKLVVERICEGRSGEISLPVYASMIGWLGVLPWSLQRLVRWAAGVDGAMEGEVQRRARERAKGE
ncbi:hypothetical protein B0A48_08358 [Cryoendolithus antarcticus]|uniref:Ketoreductase domain-containing protein n=1 Tax=Cryoendolithus antarcticus TaxID=1507870 RepID=A0A1V8T583_9PEZI|nr:hypothetical protein B0A48_08358 [Cryoendolithus antarcticus]